MTDPDNGVRYSQREMFDRIDRKLDDIGAKLDAKADDVAFQALVQRVVMLELWRAGSQGSEQRAAQLSGRSLAWAAVIIALLGTIAYLVAASH